MTVFSPNDATALRDHLKHHTAGLLIACYCAAWCDTCRDYEPEFNTLATRWPQHTFVWIDIEDHPELLDDDDVDDFPTILIQNEHGNVFFGEQLPYIAHLDRLIESLQGDPAIIQGGPRLIRRLIDAA